MKRLPILGIVIFLLISNIIFIYMTVMYKNKIDKQIFKVYSFEGESNEIKISDGIIVIYPNKQILNGGKIQYLGNKQENITTYTKNIYISRKGNDKKILSNAITLGENGNEAVFPDEFLLNKDIGEISSEKLFNDEDISSIKDNLYFSLNYSASDGKNESIITKLKVKEFDMKDDK